MYHLTFAIRQHTPCGMRPICVQEVVVVVVVVEGPHLPAQSPGIVLVFVLLLSALSTECLILLCT